jgi:putative ABC transport system permease protein
MLLLGAFAGLALLLALIGVHGVLSYAVARRQREVGIRMALGATRGDVLRAIVAQGMGPAAAGIMLGVSGAAAASGVLRGLLFGVGATDPLTYVGVAAAVALAALLAAVLPAVRAARIDPIRVLRTE